MRHAIVPATIVALVVIFAAMVFRYGRYQAINMGEGKVAVVDRWTGKTDVTETRCPADTDPFSDKNFFNKKGCLDKDGHGNTR